QVRVIKTAGLAGGFDRGHLVFENRFRIEQEPADERRFAVVHRTRGSEPQQVHIGAGRMVHVVHQKYPSFLRSSIAASEKRSSPRVAPRSVTRTVAISLTIFSMVSASDSTQPVNVMSPTVRKRTLRFSICSLPRGCTYSDTDSKSPSRSMTSRSWAK